MRKTKFTRILCLALSVLFLVSGAVVSVGAATSVQSSTAKSELIADYEKELGTISYIEYMALHAEHFKADSDSRLTQKKVFDLSTMDLVFTDKSKNVVTITNGGQTWSLKTPAGQTYTSVDEAVQAGFSRAGLVYVTDEFGRPAIYTPSTGETKWELNLAAMGIDEPTLCSIQLVYYPVLNLKGVETPVGKSAAIERQFSLGTGIDVTSPFKEARALRLSKVWSSFSSNQTGVYAPMVASYYPENKAESAAIIQEAQTLGIAATLKTDAVGKEYVEVVQPTVMTNAINAFVDKYELRFFTTDIDGNELRPSMQQTPEWITYTLRDGEGSFSDDFGFVLEPENGSVTAILEGINEPMAIAEIVLKPYESVQSYDTYINNINKNVGNAVGQDTVKIEAEMTINTSTNVVYPIEDRTSPITSPVDTSKTHLNTIGTEKWATSGQWIEYKFSVASSGMYDVISRFKQSYLDGLYVCRTLELYVEDYTASTYYAKYKNTSGYYNGVPFAEAGLLRFDYDTDWQVSALTDGNKTYPIYLEKDVVYSIRFGVTLGSKNALVQEVEDILENLNRDYLDILKLTGADPDDYRTYRFYQVLPKTISNMLAQIPRLKAISAMLKETAGVASTYSGICDQLINLLDKMVKDEDEIAKNLDNYKSYVGSLGTFLTDAKTQPLQVDYFLIQPANAELPDADGNFFQKMWHEISSFIQSFFRDYNSMGAMESDEATESIEVWMVSGAATDVATYGRDQLQVVRSMCTDDFTNKVTEGKIAVNLKLVTDGTLLPSILAGLGPDVYMGLAQGNVINYAIRGALQEIEGLDGFETVTKQFNDAALIVLRMKDADDVIHYYGLPETQQFPMMFVRIDILTELNLDIPTTWDEVYAVQSVLESNNMEFGFITSYKMFLYQMGGELFADDGMRINLDSSVGIAAFTKMCDMFTQYSFPYKYNAANRFRTGEMPIIISDYVTLYNHLKVFATELDGDWMFVPLPGIKQEDGTINNSSISTTSAIVMIKGTEKIASSWEYMKWFTGDYAQAEFSNQMVSIIGDSAKHPTANISALENMPWTQTELTQVKAQFNNLASVPNFPGYYILDRYTNFAFLSAYNDNMNPQEELLSYINIINKEITRKREEFKLETLEIGQKLSDKRLAQAEEAMNALEAYNKDKYAKEIADARSIIANMALYEKEGYESVIPFMNSIADALMSYLPAAEGDATPDYFVKVSKQTSDEKFGGYAIDSLAEQQLVYFVAQCYRDAAAALGTY